MPQCAVATCTNSHRKTKGGLIRYHRFPTNATQRSRWIRACGRDTFNVNTARVCSRHFSTKNYERDIQQEYLGLTSRNRLRKDAVPHLNLSPSVVNLQNKTNYFEQRFINNSYQKQSTNPIKFSDSLTIIRKPSINNSSNNITKNSSNNLPKNTNNSFNAIILSDNSPKNNYSFNNIKILSNNSSKNKSSNNSINSNNNSSNNLAKNIFFSKNLSVTQKLITKKSKNYTNFIKNSLIDYVKQLDESCKAYPILFAVGLVPKKDQINQLNKMLIMDENESQTEIKQSLKNGDSEPSIEDKSIITNRLTETNDTDEKLVNGTENENKDESKLDEKHDEKNDDNESEKEQDTVAIETDEILEQNEDTNSNDSKSEIAQIENHQVKRTKSECSDSANSSPEDLTTNAHKKLKIIQKISQDSEKELDNDFDSEEKKILDELEYIYKLIHQTEKQWDNLLVIKKQKEETLLKLQRKKIIKDIKSGEPLINYDNSLNQHLKSLFAINQKLTNEILPESGVTIVPIKSEQQKTIQSNNTAKNTPTKPRSILPKPVSDMHTIYNNYSIGGSTMQISKGPKGPLMNVNTILQEFRQNHPDEAPRRGRRIKNTRVGYPLDNRRILSMNSNGNYNRSNSELENILTSDSTNNQSNKSPQNNNEDFNSYNKSPTSVSLLQEFAKLSSSAANSNLVIADAATLIANNFMQQQNNLSSSLLPYPEVTLHPVPSNNNVASSSSPATSTTSTIISKNSLLHGILTKNETKPSNNVAPTLAKLLTGPASQNNSNYNDMIRTENQKLYKNRGRMNSGENDVITLGGDEDPENKLVIDESRNNATTLTINVDPRLVNPTMNNHINGNRNNSTTKRSTNNNSTNFNDSTVNQVPNCYNCKVQPSQFVCAGCTKQWYCSRDCQIADWNEHCETCAETEELRRSMALCKR